MNDPIRSVGRAGDGPDRLRTVDSAMQQRFHAILTSIDPANIALTEREPQDIVQTSASLSAAQIAADHLGRVADPAATALLEISRGAVTPPAHGTRRLHGMYPARLSEQAMMASRERNLSGPTTLASSVLTTVPMTNRPSAILGNPGEIGAERQTEGLSAALPSPLLGLTRRSIDLKSTVFSHDLPTETQPTRIPWMLGIQVEGAPAKDDAAPHLAMQNGMAPQPRIYRDDAAMREGPGAAPPRMIAPHADPLPEAGRSQRLKNSEQPTHEMPAGYLNLSSRKVVFARETTPDDLSVERTARGDVPWSRALGGENAGRAPGRASDRVSDRPDPGLTMPNMAVPPATTVDHGARALDGATSPVATSTQVAGGDPQGMYRPLATQSRAEPGRPARPDSGLNPSATSEMQSAELVLPVGFERSRPVAMPTQDRDLPSDPARPGHDLQAIMARPDFRRPRETGARQSMDGPTTSASADGSGGELEDIMRHLMGATGTVRAQRTADGGWVTRIAFPGEGAATISLMSSPEHLSVRINAEPELGRRIRDAIEAGAARIGRRAIVAIVSAK